MIHLVMMIASILFFGHRCVAQGFSGQSGAVRTAIRRLNSSPARRPFVRGKQNRYESIVCEPPVLHAAGGRYLHADLDRIVCLRS